MPKAARQQPGFEVGRNFYPLIAIPEFRQGDIIMIQTVTDTEWYEWVKIVAEYGLDHPVVKMGLFAVAVQRENTGWSRRRTKDFVEGLPLDGAIELVFPPVEVGDELPPSEAAGAASSETSTSSSTSASE